MIGGWSRFGNTAAFITALSRSSKNRPCGGDGVPHLVAESGRGGARAPLRFATAECRLAAGNRGRTHCLCGRCSQGDRGARRLHRRRRGPCVVGSHGVQRHLAAAPDPRPTAKRNSGSGSGKAMVCPGWMSLTGAASATAMLRASSSQQSTLGRPRWWGWSWIKWARSCTARNSARLSCTIRSSSGAGWLSGCAGRPTAGIRL